MAQSKFCAFVVDPDHENRQRLRQTMEASGYFKDVLLLASVDEALFKLRFADRVDVIFTSVEVKVGEFARLVKDAREEAKDKDSCHVVVLGEGDDSSALVPSLLASGADSFLIAPYSVDALTEITMLATKVRQDRKLDREEASLRLLAAQMVSQLNIFSALQSLGAGTVLAKRQFQKALAAVDEFDEARKDRFLEILIEECEKAELPSEIANGKNKYAGSSRMVRKRLERKLLERLEESVSEGEQGSPEQSE